jgi:hypothetical protein
MSVVFKHKLHNFSAIDIDMFLFDKIVMPFLQHCPNSSPTNILVLTPLCCKLSRSREAAKYQIYNFWFYLTGSDSGFTTLDILLTHFMI